MTKIKNISLFIISFCITILILEIYLRLTGISMPSYAFDDSMIGRTHNPNHEIFEAKAEGFCLDEVNALGYIGSTYPPERKNDAVRIAFLGSSYVEGLQVLYRNRFNYILEKELQKKLNRKVEVLNFGIGGDDFRGMFLRYKALVRDYSPDFTLFMVKPSDFSRKKTIPAPELYLQNDSILVSYDFLNSKESLTRQRFEILRRFGIGNFLKEVYEVYFTGRLPGILLDKLDFVKAKEMRSTMPGDKYDFYDLNLKIIDELNMINQTEKQKCLIVDIDRFQEKYKEYIFKSGLLSFSIYNELEKYKPEELKYWKASKKIGHWNNFANETVGNILASKLEQLINKE